MREKRRKIIGLELKHNLLPFFLDISKGQAMLDVSILVGTLFHRGRRGSFPAFS
jgi:hypothetical protein